MVILGIIIIVLIVLYFRKKQRLKREAEEQERNETEILARKEAEKKPESLRIGNYNYESHRIVANSKYFELFYPPIGDHALPRGYHNIPVPSYIAYDLETTGLTPTHDEILEIGAIRILNGEIDGVYHEYTGK